MLLLFILRMKLLLTCLLLMVAVVILDAEQINDETEQINGMFIIFKRAF